MDEVGAALRFCEGFGENWHALGESLYYLDEWLPGDAYILVVGSSLEVLEDEDAEELGWFLKTIEDAGRRWSEPITDHGRFNRPAIPFHVVFGVLAEDVDLARRKVPSMGFLENHGRPPTGPGPG